MTGDGRGKGIVGYRVNAAVETKHHLIVAHEVTNVATTAASAPWPLPAASAPWPE
jgi:hypothetical protein